jgi:hypothetical protein
LFQDSEALTHLIPIVRGLEKKQTWLGKTFVDFLYCDQFKWNHFSYSMCKIPVTTESSKNDVGSCNCVQLLGFLFERNGISLILHFTLS